MAQVKPGLQTLLRENGPKDSPRTMTRPLLAVLLKCLMPT
jgi:hypothetical protein